MDAALFSDEWKARTLIRPRKNPEEILRALAKEQGVLSVMLEAGGKFSAAMFEAGLIDEVIIYYAPILCGGTVPALAGGGFPESISLRNISTARFGNDIRVRGLVVREEMP
jgi:diaminohydroxyphosphoribosylaminopyrimidine deaminase/5-amino-6-(5-phosphoribosylamino)uracil reductase